jgi:hypothetical protein
LLTDASFEASAAQTKLTRTVVPIGTILHMRVVMT